MNHADHDELMWAAFRYAAGEMNADECETFEAALATEQTARDALVQAVRTAQAVDVSLGLSTVQQAESAPASPQEGSRRLPCGPEHRSGRRWLARVGWMLVGGLATAVALSWSFRSFDINPARPSPNGIAERSSSGDAGGVSARGDRMMHVEEAAAAKPQLAVLWIASQLWSLGDALAASEPLVGPNLAQGESWNGSAEGENAAADHRAPSLDIDAVEVPQWMFAAVSLKGHEGGPAWEDD